MKKVMLMQQVQARVHLLVVHILREMVLLVLLLDITQLIIKLEKDQLQI